jgi:hypothetical protein
MNEYKADKQTADWLKANGWDEKTFTVIELPFLQAQQVAYCLMKYHAALLNEEQTGLLNNYLGDIKHKAKRHKITKKTVYRVLNLGSKINRQLFKAHKAINNSR